MTTADIKNFAQKMNLRTEEVFAHSHIGRCLGLSNPVRYSLGIELKPDSNIWFWFQSFELDGWNHELFFSHRYNCNNGYIMRTFNTGWKAEQIIMQHS